MSEYKKQWYLANKEKLTLNAREYYQKNKEILCEKHRAYYQKHKSTTKTKKINKIVVDN